MSGHLKQNEAMGRRAKRPGSALDMKLRIKILMPGGASSLDIMMV